MDASYDSKPASYFGNARHDIVVLMTTNASAQVLELGCGAGGTGKAVLAAGKAGHYTGIELSPTAAALAKEVLSKVIVGNVEAMPPTALPTGQDALIISEVLEHLIDPWSALSKLSACLKPGAMVYASSPNVAQWHILRDLLHGRFDYTPSGVMDSTHLRWFTPATYRALFEQAGFEIVSLKPLAPLGRLGRVLHAVFGDRFDHLFMGQIMLVGRKQ
jgi:SAM-dependent methyltransferase